MRLNRYISIICIIVVFGCSQKSKIQKPNGNPLILGFNDTSELLFFDMPKNNFYDKFSEFIPNNEILNKSRMMVDNINKHTFIFLKKI